jgi:hypothetical protein
MRVKLVIAAVVCLLLTPVLFETGIRLFSYPTSDPPLWLSIIGGIGFWFWWAMPILAISLLVAAVFHRKSPNEPD